MGLLVKREIWSSSVTERINLLQNENVYSVEVYEHYHSGLAEQGYAWEIVLNCVFKIKLFNHFLHVQSTLPNLNMVKKDLDYITEATDSFCFLSDHIFKILNF